MNPLGRRIAALIAAQGPISVAEFMTMALHDPAHGYYATKDPLGADFVTAPEISQTFGELLGLWVAQCWFDQGCPAPARFVELGPGRGTLMADALRALVKAAPGFLDAIEVVMVEAGPTLRAIQAERLRNAPAKIVWRERFDEAGNDRPLYLIANEFFDALPIRQFVFTERGWCERMVTANAAGVLAFALAPTPTRLEIPAERGTPTLGAVYEVSATGTAIAEEIGRLIAAKGGAALIVDYGYDAFGGFGETLQAVGRHRFQELLATPGNIDLTAHVDFAALAAAARLGGARALGPRLQEHFLTDLGIVGRGERLALANPAHADDINASVARLIDPGAMGWLFRALAVVAQDAPMPPTFTEDEPEAPIEKMMLVQAQNLSAADGVSHAFFGRRGGVSEGLYATLNCGPGSNDDRDRVIENRTIAIETLAPGAALLTLYQVHSAQVVTVTEAWALGQGPKADAMVTDVAGLALGILTADCAPVLFADAEARVIGAAHAGWKGALAGVTDATLAAMEKLGAKRAQIAAAIGPCISQANYEVGGEFRAQFLSADSANARFFVPSDRPDHFRFDLEGYVVHRLKGAGVANVEALATCTYASESEFYSFRRATHRAEPDYGREISAIVLS